MAKMFTLVGLIEYTALLLIVTASLWTARIALRNLGWIGYTPDDHPRPRAPAATRSENLELFAKITFWVIATRVVIYLTTYYAFVEINRTTFDFFGQFVKIWSQWDTQHYLHIAEHGYVAEGKKAALIVFYPVYPFLVKATQLVVRDYFVAGLVVSTLCLIAACFALFKLVKLEFDSEDIAWRSVKYLLIFPFSFFASIVYSESTFLFFTISSFYFMRRSKWPAAGLMGFLAAATRNQGVLLMAPMLYEIINQSKGHYPALARDRARFVAERLASFALIPTGILAYLALNKAVTGDWFTFLDHQKDNWHQSFGYFAYNVANIYKNLLAAKVHVSIGTWLPSFVMFFIASFTILASIRRIPIAYLVYSLPYLIVSYSPTWGLSIPRYLLSLFPLFIMAALLVDKRRHAEALLDFALTMFLLLFCVAFFWGTVY